MPKVAVYAVVTALGIATQSARPPARALTVWTTRALATVLAEVEPALTPRLGRPLVVISDLPNGFSARASAGEPFDVLITGAAPMDEWVRDGRVVASSRTELARSGIGVAVKAGAPKPDIGSTAAFRRALLEASSIAYLRVGSGLHLDAVLARLGIADAVSAKSMRPDTDIATELVAKGQAQLGVVVLTQIMTTPGVDLVGPLPPELQSYVTFVGGVGTRSSVPDVAAQVLTFLTSATAAAVMRAQGMEPR